MKVDRQDCFTELFAAAIVAMFTRMNLQIINTNSEKSCICVGPLHSSPNTQWTDP